MCCDLVACVWFFFGMCDAGGRGGGCVDLCECLTPFSFALSLSLCPSETAHTHKHQTEALRTNKQPKSSLSTFDTMTNKSSPLGRNNASIHTHTAYIHPLSNNKMQQQHSHQHHRDSAHPHTTHTHTHTYFNKHTHTHILQLHKTHTIADSSLQITNTHTQSKHTLALARINNTHTFI